jgi:hypothetical protein
MKKLLYIFLFSLLFLSGCEKKPAEIASADVFELTGDTTSLGISPGDGSDAFISAYKDYTIQVAYSDLVSNYLVMSIEDIPYEESISTMIANFFIDGVPTSEATLCKENKITSDQLHTLLSSPSYLRQHEVIYRYLRFIWKDGTIEHIESDSLDYNETFETPVLS